MDRLWSMFSATNIAITVGIAGVVLFLAFGDDEGEPDAPAPATPTPATLAAIRTAGQRTQPGIHAGVLTAPAHAEVEEPLEELAPPPHPVRAALTAVVEPVERFAESLSPQQQAMLVLLCLVVVTVYVVVTLLQAVGVPPTPLLAPVGWAAAGSLATFAISGGGGAAGERGGQNRRELVYADAERGGAAAAAARHPKHLQYDGGDDAPLPPPVPRALRPVSASALPRGGPPSDFPAAAAPVAAPAAAGRGAPPPPEEGEGGAEAQAAVGAASAAVAAAPTGDADASLPASADAAGAALEVASAALPEAAASIDLPIHSYVHAIDVLQVRVRAMSSASPACDGVACAPARCLLGWVHVVFSFTQLTGPERRRRGGCAPRRRAGRCRGRRRRARRRPPAAPAGCRRAPPAAAPGARRRHAS